MDRAVSRAAARGFTLIELLIVIGILGLLAAVLLPNILGASDASKQAATEATMLRLELGIEAFERAHGYFPSDDLRSAEGAAKTEGWKADNGLNTGIESLVAFLSQSNRDGTDLGELASRLVNTDKDDHGVELPVLKRKERLEIADEWGTPFAYFGKAGMERGQTVVTPQGDSLPVKALRRQDGTYYGAGKYQLLSAGKDGIFGSDDDLVWPKN